MCLLRWDILEASIQPSEGDEVLLQIERLQRRGYFSPIFSRTGETPLK